MIAVLALAACVAGYFCRRWWQAAGAAIGLVLALELYNPYHERPALLLGRLLFVAACAAVGYAMALRHRRLAASPSP